MGVPVAVVGIGCRFPGAHGADELWDLLRDGRDAVTEVPDGRFDVDLERVPNRAGGFLDGIEDFDAEFFGISPREAARMDPQQRVLLETAWEAVEDAGLLPGHRTGVFIGQMTTNYWDLLSGIDALDIYTNLGTTRSALAGRLSYALDLRGPSVAVDTACSSSLVAVHLAVRSVRSGECDLALAGGVNLILHGRETVTFAQANMISPAGRCRFGAADAAGFVRSEGAGVVVLKPLEAALADGDHVHAVIHGSATGNDGRAGYLMTPDPAGQAATIRAAYADAGLEPAGIAYVEAHGAGSAAGDPVELGALADVFGGALRTGSVKTNIGHTEAAAGVAGLIKAILCVRHREIPASLHADPPGDWKGVTIVREPTPWPPGPALAGVSAFGITGTNAHLVLAEPPPTEPERAGGGARLLTISARGRSALRALTAAYAAHPLEPLDEVCRTAALGRRHHGSRLTVVGADAAEIRGKLRAHLAGEPVPLLGVADDVADQRLRTVFVFPGQGSQWAGMGRELLASAPVFRDAMAECDAAVRAETGWSVLDRLGSGELDGIDVVQPVLWAMEVALAALWRSYGIEPDVLIGHSMGEVAAAHVAGLLDTADAAAVICRRARLLAEVAGHGGMLSTELTEDEARAEIDGDVAVAACNGPGSTVLSGDPAALGRIAARLDERGVFCRRVQVDVASHSPQMDPLLEPLIDGLGTLKSRPGEIPLHSTVSGAPVTTVDAAYWARNLRETVRFGEAVQAQGPAVFIELSPHPILLPSITESITHGVAVPSLRRGEPETATLLDGLGTLHRAGHPVPWERLYASRRRTVRLPGYPWQRTRHWPDIRSEQPVPGEAYLDIVRTAVRNAFGRTPSLRDVAFHKTLTVTLVPRADGSGRFEVTSGETVHATGGFTITGVPERPADHHEPSAEPATEPPPDRTVEEYLLDQVADVLGLPVRLLSARQPLKEQGIDSLMAIEVRTRVRRDLGVPLPVSRILGGGSIVELAAGLASP